MTIHKKRSVRHTQSEKRTTDKNKCRNIASHNVNAHITMNKNKPKSIQSKTCDETSHRTMRLQIKAAKTKSIKLKHASKYCTTQCECAQYSKPKQTEIHKIEKCVELLQYNNVMSQINKNTTQHRNIKLQMSLET